MHTIGVVQMTATENKEENFEMAKHYIIDAGCKGAKMVFLPECFDFVGTSKNYTMECAEPLDGPLVMKYRDLAIQHKLWISLGGAHRKVSEMRDCTDGRVYNTHILVDANGEIAATYDKIHLFDVTINPTAPVDGNDPESGSLTMLESTVVQPGKLAPPVVHNTPIGSIGLGICYDMRFPELAAHLRYVGGANVLTYPSAFSLPTGRAGHWHTLLRARAIENQCYVIAAAQEGAHNPKRTSYGRSLVVDPWGQIVAECTEPGPGLLLCNINQDVISNVRQSIPVWNHRRFDLFPLPDSGLPIDIGCRDYSFGPNIIPARCVFYRSALSYGFVNLSPLVPGHVLVSPIACVPRFGQLSQGQVADLYLTVKQIAGPLSQHFSATSLTISIQDGEDAGQSVPHVHIHILPRKPNDFARNDDIYDALQQHDKIPGRVRRSVDVMIAEATEFRRLFYPEDSEHS